MIDYIKGINYQLAVVHHNRCDYYDEPFSRWVNRFLSHQYATLQTRERRIKLYHNLKRKLPLILDDDHLFLCIHSYRSYHPLYINYHQIIHWKKLCNKVIIEFKTGHCMTLNSYRVFMNQIEKIRQILGEKINLINNRF